MELVPGYRLSMIGLHDSASLSQGISGILTVQFNTNTQLCEPFGLAPFLSGETSQSARTRRGDEKAQSLAAVAKGRKTSQRRGVERARTRISQPISTGCARMRITHTSTTLAAAAEGPRRASAPHRKLENRPGDQRTHYSSSAAIRGRSKQDRSRASQSHARGAKEETRSITSQYRNYRDADCSTHRRVPNAAREPRLPGPPIREHVTGRGRNASAASE